MARIKRTRPSPAILVSVIALVAALGGSAVAEVATTSKLSKKEKTQVGKIAKGKANKQIKKKAPGLSVAKAKTATTATTGAPFAYARVSAAGEVTSSAPSKNLSSEDISNPSAGTYCYQLKFTPQTGAASAESDPTEDALVSRDFVSPFDSCPANAEAEIQFFDAGASAPENEPTWVQFDG